jgi:hypothetical protein
MKTDKLIEALDRLPPPVGVGVGLALVAMIGALDYATGWEFSFGIFYLAPVALVTLSAGRRAGLAVAVVSAAVWLTDEIATNPHYTHAAAPYWNALARLGFFAPFALLLDGLKAAWRREKELADAIRQIHEDVTVPDDRPSSDTASSRRKSVG